MHLRDLLGALLVVLPVAAACGPTIQPGRVEVLETFPHDSTAFTQGLVFAEGYLYESTGRYGSSTIRRVDPRTGEVLSVDTLPAEYFGEGLAHSGDRLVQLTWKEHVAFVYDVESLAVVDTLDLPPFGWGLCSEGGVFYMTGGNSILYRRDVTTWRDLGLLEIERDGVPFHQVNELECVDGFGYGNVFQTDQIVKFELETGRIVAEFDVAALIPSHLRGSDEAVANGIAYDPGSGSFYLTGKLWPVMYRVNLIVD